MESITCCICLSNLKGVTISLCGHSMHAMHEACLDAMVRSAQLQTQCPVCRSHVETSLVVDKLRGDDRLIPHEIHVVSSADSMLVAVCRILDSRAIPTYQQLKTPRGFMHAGLKEILPRFYAENKRQKTIVVKNAAIILNQIAQAFKLFLLVNCRDLDELDTYLQYNRIDNVFLQHPGDKPDFKGVIQLPDSNVHYCIDRGFWSSYANNTGRWFSEEHGINMQTYETMYCWNIDIRLLDATPKRSSVEHRLLKAKIVD